MAKVVVVGGGWAGVGAAIGAVNSGAQVTLLERTDMLLGTGLVGGIMRNNGRFTAAEEAIALGGGELFQLIDSHARHKNIKFPGHDHASLYDVATIEPAVKTFLLEKGITIKLQSRARDVEKSPDGTITNVLLEDDISVSGDVFVDTTGTAGSMASCTRYGNGCTMCVLRCFAFGGRVSMGAKAGAEEFMGQKADGSPGAMSGSCKLNKDSLHPDIVAELNEQGVVVIAIPKALRSGDEMLASKACQQYAIKEFAENIILLDTGHAKLMAPFYPLEMLRKIPGLENARYEDPYAGTLGNSIRYLALSPRDNGLKVQGVNNLFCGGEKTGAMVGHTEGIVTGTLAGHNAVRHALGLETLELPDSLAIGDMISFVNEQMKTEEGITKKYTFSGSVYFQRMKEQGLYSIDTAAIEKRVGEVGLKDIFARKLC